MTRSSIERGGCVIVVVVVAVVVGPVEGGMDVVVVVEVVEVADTGATEVGVAGESVSAHAVSTSRTAAIRTG